MRTFVLSWLTQDHEFQPASSMHAKLTYVIMDKIHARTIPKINGVCTYVYMCKPTRLKGDTSPEETAGQNRMIEHQRRRNVTVSLSVPPQGSLSS